MFACTFVFFFVTAQLTLHIWKLFASHLLKTLYPNKNDFILPNIGFKMAF